MSAATLRERSNRTRALWLGAPLTPQIAACAERIADLDVRADFLAALETATALSKQATEIRRRAWEQYRNATGAARRRSPA